MREEGTKEYLMIILIKERLRHRMFIRRHQILQILQNANKEIHLF